jgi:hypothetical protein
MTIEEEEKEKQMKEEKNVSEFCKTNNHRPFLNLEDRK